jgi:hypothetical protein
MGVRDTPVGDRRNKLQFRSGTVIGIGKCLLVILQPAFQLLLCRLTGSGTGGETE